MKKNLVEILVATFSLLNSKKNKVISSSDLSSDKFKPIAEVLRKHECYKYNLVTK